MTGPHLTSCRAVAFGPRFCAHLKHTGKTQLIKPYLPEMTQGLLALATQSMDDVLALVLESLRIVMSVSWVRATLHPSIYSLMQLHKHPSLHLSLLSLLFSSLPPFLPPFFRLPVLPFPRPSFPLSVRPSQLPSLPPPLPASLPPSPLPSPSLPSASLRPSLPPSHPSRPPFPPPSSGRPAVCPCLSCPSIHPSNPHTHLPPCIYLLLASSRSIKSSQLHVRLRSHHLRSHFSSSIALVSADPLHCSETSASNAQ